MTEITNKHGSALALPDGQVLLPNQPTEVPNWEQVKKNAVIGAWLERGILSAAGAKEKAGGEGEGDDDKEALMVKLDALGVQYDKRSGVAKLRNLLVEAEKTAAAEGEG